MKKFFQFVFAMIISFIPGAIGIMFTPRGASDIWYNEMAKSALTPPGWMFSVAWTILYVLLGIALYLIMVGNDRSRQGKTRAYLLFVAQMALNALWSYVYFGLQMPAAALIVLVGLIIVSIWMLRVFRPISRVASALVWPYIIWMLFATYLNAVVVYLN